MDEEGHESTRPSVEICALDGALAIYVCITDFFLVVIYKNNREHLGWI